MNERGLQVSQDQFEIIIKHFHCNIIIKSMAQALIRQRTFSRKQKFTQKSMINLQLPKINSKVEQANAFLSNPLQLSKISQTDADDKEDEENVSAEPWMEDNEESDAVRKKKAIQVQIASIMGTQNSQLNELKPLNDMEELSPQKIISKMKKYQPINSSFSLSYGEKKNIEERSFKGDQISEARRRKILNLPALNFRGHSNHNKIEMELRIQDLYSLRQAKTPTKQPQKFTSYINKIKEIYKEGNALHHKSEILIHRIDKVSQFLQHKFDKFNEQSQNMLGDVGNYRLEEQTTGQYKKTLMQGIAQRFRK